jgi:hypothetical protein
MIINTQKTNYQFFSMQHNNYNFNLKINQDNLEKNENTKYLGITFDDKLKWNSRIENIENHIDNRLHILKRLAGVTWGSSQETLNKTYQIYIKPVITYGSEVLVTANSNNLTDMKLFKIEL